MAKTNIRFIPTNINKSNLNTTNITNGSVYFIEDVNELAYDFNSKRTFIKDIIVLNTESERISPLFVPLNKFYFILDTKSLWYYKEGTWYEVSSVIDLSNYYTKEEVDTAIQAKQDKLTAGTGISIVNNVISSTITPSGDLSWGRIGGNINDQQDLQEALANKVDNSILDNYATKDDIPTVPTKVSELENDSSYVKQTELSTVAITGNYDDLSNKPSIPTNLSELNNDTGYITNNDIINKADKSKTLAGYGIEDAYTKTEVDAKVSSVFRYKGSVDTYSDLPTENLSIGDTYNVLDTGVNYAWDGEKWDKLSETIDLTPYLTKTEAQTTYETIANVDSKINNLNTAISNNINTLSEKVDSNYNELNTNKVNKTDLSKVATSGSYNDLSDKPTIPTTTSQLENNSGFITDTNLTPLRNDILSLQTNKQDKLTAGTGIEITEDNIINNTQTSAEWGNIQGDITQQADLQNELNTKQNTISDLETIRINASNGATALNTINTYGDIVTHNVSEFATSTQGSLADSALQSGDNITELVNNAGYITSIPDEYITETELSNELSTYAKKSEIPEGAVVDDAFSTTSTNAVQNKVITNKLNQIEATIPTDFYTQSQVDNKVSGLQEQIENKQDIINDLNVIRSNAEIGASLSEQVNTNKDNISSLQTSKADKSELPTVNNKTLTIQKNGTEVAKFTANSNLDVTANISVPVNVSELNNNSGYITKDVNNLTNYTKTTDLPTKLSEFTNDTNFQNDTQVNSAISTHNSSQTAHADIRNLINDLQTQVDDNAGDISVLEADKQDVINDLTTIRNNAQIGAGLQTQVQTNTDNITGLQNQINANKIPDVNGGIYKDNNNKLFLDIENTDGLIDIIISDTSVTSQVSSTIDINLDNLKQVIKENSSGNEPDNKTINLNLSDQLQAIGFIESNDSIATKIWIGTKAEYESISQIDPDTLYNVTDDDEQSVFSLEIPIATTESIGAVKPDGVSIKIDENGVISTETVSKGTLENVLTQYSKTVLTTEADYEALVEAGTVDENTLYLIEE